MPAFLNPALLWGLAAAAVPIAIHLLHRRRYQRQPWAAMEWLLAAVKQNQKRLQMENLLLLLVRTCAVLFLALAIARPTLSSAANLLGGPKSTHLYVLLDNSASTAARAGTRTVFDEALGEVSSQVSALADADPVTIVLTNDNWSDDRRSGRPRAILRDSRDHGAVRRRLGELRPAAARADLAEALKVLEEQVRTSPGERRVAIVTDLQAITVEGLRDTGTEERADPVRTILARLRQAGAEIVLLPVGRDVPNVAVTALRPAEDRDVVQGATAVFHAEIRNYSDRAQRVEVTFTVDGEERGESSQFVTLPPRAGADGAAPAATAQFWTTFKADDVGTHVLEARIPADPMPLDDSRALAFEVRPAVRVLLVDGDPRPADGRDPETRWLARAVGLQESGPFLARTVTEAEFHALRDLSGEDMVVLANVRRPAPTAEARDRLEAWVRAGGGLLLTVGDQTDPAVWNEELHRREGGLLPSRLGEAKVDRSAILRMDLSANRHPIFADITDPTNASYFESPVLHGYMTLDGLAAEKDANVVLRFADLAKTPLLVERRVGRGTVLVHLSTIDDDWGRLLGSYLFPIFVHKTIFHLTARGNADRNVLCFQPWTRTVPRNFVNMEITKPDGTSSRTDRDVSADAAFVRFGETELPGIYRATGTLRPASLLEQTPPPFKDVFTASLPPLESDTRRIPPEAAFARWQGLVSSGRAATDTAEAARARAGELATPLLVAALLCLLAEIFLVQRIGRRRL